ncbi:hypothetical protein [Mycobacterium sp. PSTR-4-N]|uniref:hypothetical protein n=1 Tax=Mycobacterium sp. PSTR-4-N TaxID=2917745 RepID=UPI001F151E64|nr:hypothetical protein [Mycobacterium sp. PSTR-4-N]MCG7592431.1 hypothetical protein [Mycobacterium sp. PSTR-4-N]
MTITTDLPGQEVHDTQEDSAGHPPTREEATPTAVPSAGYQSAKAESPPTAVPSAGYQSAKAESPPNPSTPTGPSSPPPIVDPIPKECPAAGPLLADPVLGLFADVLDDLETVRIANQNRLRQLTDAGPHGHGLSLHSGEVKRLASLVEHLEASEHQAVLCLQRAIRVHPLGAWVKNTHGVGEKQAARLLASIRDPYWNDLHERPRTVSELWAYCGFHTIETAPGARMAPKHRRGQRSNWNTLARTRVWLIAESCVRSAASPYRSVYDTARAKYADATHAAPCQRCGPSGTPAAAGTPLSLGHQHARAMRLMCKEILRDLWHEAQRLHELPA